MTNRLLINNLDFTPLEQNYSPFRVFKKALRFKNNSSNIFGFFWFMFVFVSFIPFILFMIYFSIIKLNLIYSLFAIGLAWILGFTAVYFYKKIFSTFIDHEKSLKFADINKIKFIENTSVNYKGVIFPKNHTKTISSAYQFPEKYNFEFGNIDIVNPYANGPSIETYGYIRININQNLPNLFLDNVTNNLFEKFKGAISSIDSQKLSLEGDFDNYYQLYVPSNFKQDALYLITPNVMQRLIEIKMDYDIEIIDNKIYLFRAKRISLADSSEITQVFNIADEITNILQKQMNQYRELEKIDYHKQKSTYQLRTPIPIIELTLVLLFVILAIIMIIFEDEIGGFSVLIYVPIILYIIYKLSIKR